MMQKAVQVRMGAAVGKPIFARRSHGSFKVQPSLFFSAAQKQADASANNGESTMRPCLFGDFGPSETVIFHKFDDNQNNYSAQC
jgi:hypothetical protein